MEICDIHDKNMNFDICVLHPRALKLYICTHIFNKIEHLTNLKIALENSINLNNVFFFNLCG